MDVFIELSGHVQNETGAMFEKNTPATHAHEPSSRQKLSNFRLRTHPFNCRNEGGEGWIINEWDLVFEIILGL